MRAWQLDRLGGTLKLTDVPVPDARPGTVVVRLEATTLMSYLDAYVAGKLPFYTPPPQPYTIGSNGIFTIHAVGRDVWHLRPGQRVVVSPHLVAQEHVATPTQILLGTTSLGGEPGVIRDFPDGVLADYAVVPKQLVTPVDDIALAPTQLAAANRFIVPYGGWLRARLAAGETALVTGATGAYGSAAVVLALALGAGRVIAAGRDPEALTRIARDRVVTVRLTGDRAADTKALRAAGPADAGLDLVGTATDPNATLAGLHALRRGGRYVLMGSATCPIPIDYMQLLVNDWELSGQFMYPADGYRRLFGLVRAGLLDLRAVTPLAYPLAELPAAMAAASRAANLECVVVTP
jgi:alcohol dehydrogenase